MSDVNLKLRMAIQKIKSKLRKESGMNYCDGCDSKRVVSVDGKCGDLIALEYDGYEVSEMGVLPDLGIGGGDYIRFSFCLDCGKIQGVFPVEGTEIEEKGSEDDEDEIPDLEEDEADFGDVLDE